LKNKKLIIYYLNGFDCKEILKEYIIGYLFTNSLPLALKNLFLNYNN
jgi:hypothetical protein